MLRRSRRQRPEADPLPSRVLVVADDEDAGELLTRLLARAGYETGRDSGDTDTVSRLSLGDIGCVVLDLGAGQPANGLRLLDAIRSHSDAAVSGVRVVLLGAHAQNRVFSWQSGVDAFLVHPFHADDFLQEVAETMARPDEERLRHRHRRLTEAGGRDPG